MSRDRATDILDVLLVTGGVPRYLEEVNPALPADEKRKPLQNGPFVGSCPQIFALTKDGKRRIERVAPL